MTTIIYFVSQKLFFSQRMVNFHCTCKARVDAISERVSGFLTFLNDFFDLSGIYKNLAYRSCPDKLSQFTNKEAKYIWDVLGWNLQYFFITKERSRHKIASKAGGCTTRALGSGVMIWSKDSGLKFENIQQYIILIQSRSHHHDLQVKYIAIYLHRVDVFWVSENRLSSAKYHWTSNKQLLRIHYLRKSVLGTCCINLFWGNVRK